MKNLPYGDIGASFTPGAKYESSSSHTSLQSFRTDALVLSTPSLSTGSPSMSRAPSATRYCFAWGCPYDPAPWTTITLSADSSAKLLKLDFFSGATSAIASQQVMRASTFSVSGSPSLMVMAAPPSFTMTSTVPSAGGATRVTLRSGADFLGAFSFFRFSPCVRMAFSAPPTLRFRSIDLTIEFSRLDKMPHQP